MGTQVPNLGVGEALSTGLAPRLQARSRGYILASGRGQAVSWLPT